MAFSRETLYPPPLEKSQVNHLATIVNDWSIANGLAVRPAASFVPEEQDPHRALATTAPVTLFPSLFPRKCFEEAKAIQLAYNELYARIAMNEEWLETAVAELLGIDDFIENLWKIHLAVKKEGYAQNIHLGLFRSDYMIHLDPSYSIPIPTIRQVEFNTIAASFGGLSTKVSELHRFLCDTKSYPIASGHPSVLSADLAENNSINALAKGLAKASRAYGAPKSSARRPLCILFIVQDPERNTFDQKHIEYALQTIHGLNVFRLPFEQVLNDTKVEQTSRALIYRHTVYPDRLYEVSTVYLRAGYAPSEYENSVNADAWASRLHLERSAAIKCPSILTHLAGSKKIQQILATPGSAHLSDFLKSASNSVEGDMEARVQRTFAPMYPMDSSPSGLEARRLALDKSSSAHFVLKPQREGGGNNIYRAAIPEFLQSIPESKWPAYILMEMIETPKDRRNTILRNGESIECAVISELGVYGVCLWQNDVHNNEQILVNEEAGYLLRTKGESSEEGGVAAGFGSVDSCYLYDG